MTGFFVGGPQDDIVAVASVARASVGGQLSTWKFCRLLLDGWQAWEVSRCMVIGIGTV